MPFIEKLQKNPVALPQIHVPDPVKIDPLQHALVTLMRSSGPFRHGIEKHVLRVILFGRVKCNDAIQRHCLRRQACLFINLTFCAVFRTLAVLKMPADANPFILIDIIFLHHTVKHQCLPIFHKVAERCKFRHTGHFKAS